MVCVYDDDSTNYSRFIALIVWICKLTGTIWS